MCGIFLSLSTKQHVSPSERHYELLRRRGPDSFRELKQETNHVYLTCCSTVLALRGDHTVVQPIQHDSHKDAILCWNGEAWKIDAQVLTGNDSVQIFHLLAHAFSTASSTCTTPHQVIQNTLAAITGPYAFAYLDPASNSLFFGRDPLGRRSLMYRHDHDGNLIISTISDSTEPGWQEVEADGIYSINLDHFHKSQVEKYSFTPSCIPYLDSPNTILPSSTPHDTTPPHLDMTLDSVHIIEELLRKSLHLRVSNIPHHSTTNTNTSLPAASLAILFSGGLDCTLLARLSNDFEDPQHPIDLINVAFENPRVHRRPKDEALDEPWSPYELCPDRITGRASFAELKQVCPNRQWRFLAVNVPYQETLASRPEVISLIHPHDTEMDLSIASALYFASRGTGLLTTKDVTDAPYTTEARVLLSGLGADELFAGYTRHATAFRREGFSGLSNELNLDVSRLGKRNLGRDDRVLSNWARETRFPFLDEDVVKWAVNAPVSQRCGFGEEYPTGETASLEPGKKVLRCLAWKLGMKNVAAEKKRAIQFGARTAKMEAGNSKGTQRIT